MVVVENTGSLKPCHILLKQSSENVFLSDKKIAGLGYMTWQWLDSSFGQVNLYVHSKLLCKFACDYNKARDKTDNFSSQTLLELMCFNFP